MTSGFTPDPGMVTGLTLTFFRRQPHNPDAGLRQARICLREIVPVSMDEMTLPSAASDTGRRHVDGLPSAIVVPRLDADHTGQRKRRFEPANVVWFPLMTLPVDQAPVQKRLRTSSVQFQDFRSIRAHNPSPSNKA